LISIKCGGEGGIRTHVTVAGKPHFECGAFDHSATSPRGLLRNSSRSVEGGRQQEARPLADGFALAKTRVVTKYGHIPDAAAPDACFATAKAHIARMERAEFFSSQAGRTIIAPRQTRARFGIGDVVRHRLFTFRGVVFDIDPVFANSEEWYQSIPEDIRPRRDQPFYHLLAENEDSSYVAYVSQGNLLADPQGGPVDHPTVRQLFESFKDGRYRMRASLTH
jgi:heat shock protein HspQ